MLKISQGVMIMGTSKQRGISESPVWEGIYSEGRSLNRYPFDMVVQFIYRNYPRSKPRAETKILEIGCGAGNNLWFAAREGFNVTGVDSSPSAIEYARKRFADDGLAGDLLVADFTDLSFPDDKFDFVIDRASITCTTFESAQQIIGKIHRSMSLGGKFFFNPYSDHDSSFVSGKLSPDGRTIDISAGTKMGVGPIYFYSKREILALFAENWKLLSLRHLEITEEIEPLYLCHAEWIAIAEKI
jgi:ubiquinone/menaquinone biosynthesis C-methylase UbiE